VLGERGCTHHNLRLRRLVVVIDDLLLRRRRRILRRVLLLRCVLRLLRCVLRLRRRILRLLRLCVLRLLRHGRCRCGCSRRCSVWNHHVKLLAGGEPWRHGDLHEARWRLQVQQLATADARRYGHTHLLHRRLRRWCDRLRHRRAGRWVHPPAETLRMGGAVQ